MQLYIPARTSSIITPKPPLIFSISLIPNGLKISNNRNSKNANNMKYQLNGTTANNAIQTPTISSTTIREGSLPQTGSNTLAFHIPKTVNNNININKIVVYNRMEGDRSIDNTYHTKVAKTAPAVPGANGVNPAPNPVAITT